MKKTILLIAILLILIVGIGMGSGNGSKDLVGSGFNQVLNKSTPVPSSTIAPPNAPKTYFFDPSTDLKVELEKVNPQILDSDFE